MAPRSATQFVPDIQSLENRSLRGVKLSTEAERTRSTALRIPRRRSSGLFSRRVEVLTPASHVLPLDGSDAGLLTTGRSSPRPRRPRSGPLESRPTRRPRRPGPPRGRGSRSARQPRLRTPFSGGRRASRTATVNRPGARRRAALLGPPTVAEGAVSGRRGFEPQPRRGCGALGQGREPSATTRRVMRREVLQSC